jgi:low affinity Fe/Cu permease
MNSKDAQRGPFERFASRAARVTSGATFFAACVLLVLVWAPSYFLFRKVDTWQLVINSATTIITFLLVALLQNTQSRSTQALHEKLDAIADGLADLMEHQLDRDRADLTVDIEELKGAVGLQHER